MSGYESHSGYPQRVKVLNTDTANHFSEQYF